MSTRKSRYCNDDFFLSSPHSIFDNIFRAVDSAAPVISAVAESAGRSFALNVESDQRAYYVNALLPGLSRDKIDISVEDGNLVLSIGECLKNEESDESATESSECSLEECCDGSRSYTIREWKKSSGKRVIALPKDADADSISASLKDGVLAVIINKLAEKQAKKVTIN